MLNEKWKLDCRIRRLFMVLFLSFLALGTVSAEGQKEKEEIVIGRPIPVTGGLSVFAEPTPWLVEKFESMVNEDGGIYIAEYDKKLPIRIKVVDTQSSPAKTSEVGAQLILKDNVDVLYVSGAPPTVGPITALAEQHGVPCVSTNMPSELFMMGGDHKWCYNSSLAIGDVMDSLLQIWDKIPNNKVVAVCAQSDPDGVAWAEQMQKIGKEKDYTVVDAGRFPEGATDYTSLISGWKEADAEILIANMSPPDFALMWRQCFREGYLPKVAIISKALGYPSAVEAVGDDLAVGTIGETSWHPSYPYTSSLSGYDSTDIKNLYEEETGTQWTAPIGGNYNGYEIIIDAITRAQSLDPEKIRQALEETELESIMGTIVFNENHTCSTPVVAHQWVKGTRFPFDSKLISNGKFSNLTLEAEPQSLLDFH